MEVDYSSSPVGYVQNVEALNSGPPNTNPSSGRKEDLNPGGTSVQRPNH